MNDTDGFTDSTDWLQTPLSSLAPLEAALRCQVCKDFFTTPMITSCSHTFCSLCIRRYLSQEGRCPACRESDQEIKLRRNWAVEEVVTQFQAGRKDLLKTATSLVQERKGDVERPKKRRKVGHKEPLQDRRNTRSQSRRVTSIDESRTSAASVHTIEDSDEGSVYQDESISKEQDTEPHDGLVACPCCGKRMKEAFINSHLDRCMAGEASPSPPRQSSTPQPHPPQQPTSIAYGQNKSAKQYDRLPTVNYSMFTDTALRKKLKDLGIPNHGSKELMRKRHTEWINLWNANCDSLHPVSKQSLLRDLDTWERTLGRQVDRGPSGVMIKEFDRDNWQKSNKNDFDDLIKRAREKRAAVLVKTDATTNEVDLNGQPEILEDISKNGAVTVGQSEMNGDHRDHASPTINLDHQVESQTSEHVSTRTTATSHERGVDDGQV